ncbi:MAG TPA: PorV/PorQ family protein [Bacteroidota bacterium]|nr:PorV/PorQ family protein [Bacteroidota bacterium]
MKKILNHFIRRGGFVTVLTLMILSAALAGNPTRTGSSGAEELLIPVGARGIALGESSLMSAIGVDAIYWNPAGLSRGIRGTEAEFSYLQYFADVKSNYGAVSFSGGDIGNFGVSLKSLTFGEIPVTTADYPDGTGSTFSPSYITFGGTYSKLLTDKISVGVTANLITEKIMSTSASGVGFNFGIQYFGIGIPELNLGIAVKNVGPQMTYSGSDLLVAANAQASLRGNQNYTVQAASFSLPSSMEIGLAYSKKLDEQNSVMFGGNFQNNNSTDDVYGIGGEYGYNNNFFIRASYLSAPQAANDATGTNSMLYDYALGAGVHYDAGGADLTFDYAYRHLRFMESNNAVTLKVGF